MPRNTTGLLKGGKKGNKGGGRPTNEWKTFCTGLMRTREVRQALANCLLDPESKGYGAALKLVMAHAHGEPERNVKVTADGEILVKWEKPG